MNLNSPGPFPWLQTLLPPSTLDNSGGKTCSPTPSQLKQYSATGTRTRVARVRADYPDTKFHSKPKLETTPSAPALPFLLSPQQLQMVPSGLEPETLWLLAIRSDQLSYETRCWPLQLLGQGFRLPFLFTHLKSAHHSQFARSGVDAHAWALLASTHCMKTRNATHTEGGLVDKGRKWKPELRFMQCLPLL